MVLIVLCFGVDFFVLFEPYVRFHILVQETEWPPIVVYYMFFCYKNISAILVCLWSGRFFLIVSFPDHCLLVPVYVPFKIISARMRWANQ